jgi:hypothetical protein
MLTELWHMTWAFIKGIFRLHWAPSTVKGDCGLHVAAEKLRHKLNPNDLEFLSGRKTCRDHAHNYDSPLYKVWSIDCRSFQCDDLNFFHRAILHQKGSSLFISNLKCLPHILEELNLHSSPGHFLRTCSFDELHDLARTVYTMFTSMQSTCMVLYHDMQHPMQYF